MGKKEYELKPKNKDPSFKRIHGNYPAKKYKKGTPVQTRLSFELGGPGTEFIDIAQALSIINRRAYRQGCYYYINSIELYNNENAHVDIHTLPDTWITRAAYRRALAIWNEQNQRVMTNTGDIAGKWHDFKVYMDLNHAQRGSTPPSLHGPDALYEVKSADDWNYSKMVSADDNDDGVQDADSFVLHMLGGHDGSTGQWDSVGVIKSYEDTRSRVSTDEPVINNLGELQDDPLFNLFDYSTENQINDVMVHLSSDADAPPYDASEMIGNDTRSLQQVARLATTDPSNGGRRIDIASGFCVPLGLLCVDPSENVLGAYRIVINLAVGTYNGVYAERVA